MCRVLEEPRCGSGTAAHQHTPTHTDTQPELSHLSSAMHSVMLLHHRYLFTGCSLNSYVTSTSQVKNTFKKRQLVEDSQQQTVIF